MKTLLWSLIAVLVIGAGAYFGIQKHNANSVSQQNLGQQVDQITVSNPPSDSTQNPSATTSVIPTTSNAQSVAPTGKSAGSSSYSTACDYLTSSDISNIMGSTIIQGEMQISPELVCQYTDTTIDKLSSKSIVASVQIVRKNDPNVNVNNTLIAPPPGTQTLQGIGEKAWERSDSNGTTVWFFKNRTQMFVMVSAAVSNFTTKAEKLASTIANKL